MKRSRAWISGGLAAALYACAGWDNPTALEDLQTTAEFEIEAARVETFEEVEIHVHVRERGSHVKVTQAQLEIEHAASGTARTVAMEPEGDGYAAHVMFFEEGEHHMHFMGVPARHRLMWELGEHELHVHNAHRIIGPYWVELEVSPAPVLEGNDGHIHVHVFELLPDGTAGAPVSGLDVELAIHSPSEVETVLTVVEEEEGEYEGEYAFGAAGTYELHVEIEVDGGHEEGEFHIPVLSPEGEQEPDDGGPGHGHGG